MNKLLEIRNKLNAKRHEFRKQDAHKHKDLSSAWRKPRGLHSKIRMGLAGHAKKVKTGYRGPAEIRGMSKDGFVQIYVKSLSQLQTINPKTEGALVGNVGDRLKLMIIQECKKNKIKILNFDAERALEAINKNIAQRKEATQARKQKQTKAAKETASAPAKSEKPAEPEKTPEEKRKETEKLLTKRE